jgi:hypothetical protein
VIWGAFLDFFHSNGLLNPKPIGIPHRRRPWIDAARISEGIRLFKFNVQGLSQEQEFGGIVEIPACIEH